MKYNGVELKEITEPQVFNPPEEMVVWDNDANKKECIVAAILPVSAYPVITTDEAGRLQNNYLHCAKIPEVPKSRRATNQELSKWLAQGNGEWGKSVSCKIERAEIAWWYECGYESEYLQKEIKVRKWDDSKWHEPTLEYMELNNGN